jgi:hypothetical protein
MTPPPGARQVLEVSAHQQLPQLPVWTRLRRPRQPPVLRPWWSPPFLRARQRPPKAGGAAVPGHSVPLWLQVISGPFPACLPGLPAPRWSRGGTMSGPGLAPPPPRATAAASDSQSRHGARHRAALEAEPLKPRCPSGWGRRRHSLHSALEGGERARGRDRAGSDGRWPGRPGVRSWPSPWPRPRPRPRPAPAPPPIGPAPGRASSAAPPPRARGRRRTGYVTSARRRSGGEGHVSRVTVAPCGGLSGLGT